MTTFPSGTSRTAPDSDAQTGPGCVRIRLATPGDVDAVISLILLIDLHQSDEGLREVMAAVRDMITQQATSMLPTGHLGPDWNLSHGYNHVLIAEHEGHPAGVVRCGPVPWIARHSEIRRVPFLAGRLMRRISAIGELAVLPELRGQGIARALVSRAEQDYRQAGFRAMSLRHDRDLTRFYTGLGYASASRLTLDVPALGRVHCIDRGWRHAVKPLMPPASVRDIHGVPVLTGMVD
ncbi:GNAT family N-acetyltransferase [Kitasatospora sp. NPDC057542]|uniref:GNAT family N-acetyltransferase n=1 Tax=Kitasatospora sp. NPDC057542 TaxID=3346162 RepID=UPI00369B2B91